MSKTHKRVRMLTLSAGPNGVRRVGEIYSVPIAEADGLITGRYAVEVDERGKRETASKPAPADNAAKDQKPAVTPGKPAGGKRETASKPAPAAAQAPGNKPKEPVSEPAANNPAGG